MRRFIALLCCMSFLTAMVVPEGQAQIFQISGGVSKTFNARWTESLLSMNENLSYNMETTDFTMIEGKICNTQTGVALGVNLDLDDNYVGKANKVAGYIGFDRLYIRYHNGTFKGTTTWTGKLGTGQSMLTPFNGAVTHVDLVYWIKSRPMYFGVGYTAYAIPMEVKCSETNSDVQHQVVATSFFDPDYKGTYYDFVFGFDTFSSSLLYFDSKDLSAEGRLLQGDRSPWGIFFVAQDRFGFGSDRISDNAMAAARELNPGRTPIGNSFFSTYLENTSSMGVRWRGISRYGRIVVGLGYELAFLMTLDINGGASTRADLGLSPTSSIARYGPVARVYMQW